MIMHFIPSISLKVQNNIMTIYLECREYTKITLNPYPKQIKFDPASTLFIGHNGTIGGHFEVNYFKLELNKF